MRNIKLYNKKGGLYMNDLKEHINYDQQHDILYIHFNDDPKIGYEDEISPGIFLRKDEESDKVLGIIILGYRKRMEGGKMMNLCW